MRHTHHLKAPHWFVKVKAADGKTLKFDTKFYTVVEFDYEGDYYLNIFQGAELVCVQTPADHFLDQAWVHPSFISSQATLLISTGSHVSPSSPTSDGRSSEAQPAENAGPSGKAESLSGEVPPTRVGRGQGNTSPLCQVSESAPIAKEAVVEQSVEANPSALQIHL